MQPPPAVLPNAAHALSPKPASARKPSWDSAGLQWGFHPALCSRVHCPYAPFSTPRTLWSFLTFLCLFFSDRFQTLRKNHILSFVLFAAPLNIEGHETAWELVTVCGRGHHAERRLWFKAVAGGDALPVRSQPAFPGLAVSPSLPSHAGGR